MLSFNVMEKIVMYFSFPFISCTKQLRCNVINKITFLGENYEEKNPDIFNCEKGCGRDIKLGAFIPLHEIVSRELLTDQSTLFRISMTI